MTRNFKILTKSAEETKKIGAALACQTMSETKFRSKEALVIGLDGELGSGKTTFAQGFAKGLGVRENPRSPTFVIMQIYPVRNSQPPKALRARSAGAISNAASFIHIDAYRINSKDLKRLGWRDLVKNPRNIILIEWGNRVKKVLPKNSLRVHFKHGKKPNERFVTINQ